MDSIPDSLVTIVSTLFGFGVVKHELVQLRKEWASRNKVVEMRLVRLESKSDHLSSAPAYEAKR